MEFVSHMVDAGSPSYFVLRDLKVALIQVPDSYLDLEQPDLLTLDLGVSLPDVLNASTTLPIAIEPYLFYSTKFPPFQTPRNVVLPLLPFLRDGSLDLSIALRPSDASTWLQYDANTKIISGQMPDVLAYNIITVDMFTTSPMTRLNASASVNITICDKCDLAQPLDLTHQARILRDLAIFGSVAGVALAVGLVFFLYKKMKTPPVSPKATVVRKDKSSSLNGTPKYLSVAGATLVEASPTPALLNARKKWWEPWNNNGSPKATKPTGRSRWMSEDNPTPPVQRIRSHSLPMTPSSSLIPDLPASQSTPFHYEEAYQSQLGPADIPSTSSCDTTSSLASWESADTWERSRRANYERPQQRPDFAPARPPHERSPIEISGSRTRTPRNDDSAPAIDPDSVFFPRPIGAETPGAGMARSPHLEGLSKFRNPRPLEDES